VVFCCSIPSHQSGGPSGFVTPLHKCIRSCASHLQVFCLTPNIRTRNCVVKKTYLTRLFIYSQFCFIEDIPLFLKYNDKFDILRIVHRDIFLEINQREALISQIYFWNVTLHVSDSKSVHHQESSTVLTAIGKGHTDYADRLLAGSRWNCCVYSTRLLMMDRYCPKNVQSYSKNKFQELVLIFGFTKRIQ